VLTVSSPAIVSFALPLADEGATARLAASLARLARPGDVIALAGELGSGKTSFARAFIRALGDAAEEVPSPTFSLVQTYETQAGSIWHFDLYRLARCEEALELGFEDALAEAIVLIEWPERLGALLPEQRLELRLDAGATPDSRMARIAARGSWADRVMGLRP
jgi:tRNA threonylcarbamoyladenosine biosynthesis protein TsaE